MLTALALALLQDPAAAREYRYPDFLTEFWDLRFLTQPPAQGERCIQFSSYDRASQAGPGQPEAWFANNDAGNFLRVEQVPLPGGGTRTEYVLADVDGPGVIQRIWSANPAGELLFYVDGAAEPALTIPFQELCQGDRAPFLDPLCGVQAKGWNCYLPLPFQKHLKLSATAGGFYYQVNVRLFPPETKVPSLSAALLEDNAPAIKEVCAILSQQSPPYRPERSTNLTGKIMPGKTLDQSVRGEGTVREIWVWFTPLAAVQDVPAMLRSVRLHITSGDSETPLVDCPVGDFFGAGPGLVPFATYYAGISADGKCYSRLPLTYSGDLHVRFTNEGTEPANLRTEVWFDRVRSGPLTLRAAWKQERDFATRPMRDYRVLEAEGPGRFIGCSLSVRNPVREWWGEGDEKFYVDGESFPSTFGTGTEDYFGYAWCSPELFSHPFHAQARCDGPGNYGFTSVNRYQIGDHVPFQKSFTFDLEVWHWNESARMDYATVAYWYAAPTAKHGLPPLPPAAERVARPLAEYPVFRVPGALEAESLRVTAVTRGKANVQEMSGYGAQWSGEKQLWWTGAQPGETMVLALPVPAAGRYALKAQFTKASDYGVVTVMLDGKVITPSLDLYHDGVVPAVVDLGVLDLAAGDRRLALRIDGKNEQAKPEYMVGIDYFLLEPEGASSSGGGASGAAPRGDSLYALSAPSLDGQDAALSQFSGRVALVVNVASECGYTPQYAGLQELHENYGPRGLVVLGFPSNEFGGQEPGDAAAIRKFCTDNYQVTFPLFAKVVTKPGAGQSPVYAFLTQGREAPGWNFCKYLVGKDGRVQAFFPSKVAPDSPDLQQAIEAALAD
ncbi:MAG: DUF2961 domain-containing protein [Planctomycetota bacterium]|nr:MAG: DUF2961 domain-containing protein [Planctomycetota bacterium]